MVFLLDKRIKVFDKHIQRAASGWVFWPVIECLMALLGFSLLAATSIGAELVGLVSIATAPQFIAYSRVVPSEHSSVTNGMDAPHPKRHLNMPKWCRDTRTKHIGAFEMKITTVGIDLAKHVFQTHAANAQGKALLNKQLPRSKMAEFFINLPPCLIAMGACSSTHFWARKFAQMGHTVTLIAPQFVKPYVKSNKNDAADAEAICEAVTRPTMCFVPVKNGEQQSVLSLHTVRQGFVKARTAQANQIRGLLAEFGLIVPLGIHHLAGSVPTLIENAQNQLPGSFRLLIELLLDHLKMLNMQVLELESQIKRWHSQNEASMRLEQIPGVGPITASAMVASLGDAKNFDNGRQVAAWLGLVPRQHSSGGKARLLGISKRGAHT